MALTKAKQQRLKDLLKQLDNLENAGLGMADIDKDANALVKDLMNKEIGDMTARVEGSITVQAIQQLISRLANVKSEISVLKDGIEKFDFEPLLQPLQDSVTQLSKELEVSKKDLLFDFEKRIKGIPIIPDLTEEVEALRMEFEEKIREIGNSTVQEDLDSIREQLQVIVAGNIETNETLQTNVEENVGSKFKELQKQIEKVRSDLNNRISNFGGGSQPLQINVNSSVMSTKYADVNFLQGGNIGWSVADDDVLKRTNIQASILVAGGGAGTPGGADTQVQFNDGGSFGGDVALTWASSVLSVGQQGSVAGMVDLAGATEQTVRVQVPSTAGSWVLTLPANDGDAGQYLVTDGNGITQWASVTAVGGSGITRTVSVLSVSSTLAASANTDYAFFPNVGINLTLPTAISNTNRYTVKNMVVSSILISAATGEDIDGAITALLTEQYESIDLQSNGSVWGII